jgi:N-acyl amino acid synthase of PEP-CTERM/exosortase system
MVHKFNLFSKVNRSREMLQLHRHFNTYFQVIPAVTPELVREAQLIRHDVYSAELGWEPISQNGLESDDCDDRSIHCLLKAVRSQRYIGCVRLILPQQGDQERALPIQLVCKGKLDAGYPEPKSLLRQEAAEVSRLAIVHEYRRRKNEQGAPIAIAEEDYSLKGRRRFPYIPVGLYIGMLHVASFHGIKYLYILTEPLLAIHFSRLGGKLQPIGKAVEHRGKRRPYLMDVDSVLRHSNLLLWPLIRSIKKSVLAQLAEHQKQRSP